MHVNVVAIMNDTVGTLMSLAYVDPSCHIAVVVGKLCKCVFLWFQ